MPELSPARCAALEWQTPTIGQRWDSHGTETGRWVPGRREQAIVWYATVPQFASYGLALCDLLADGAYWLLAEGMPPMVVRNGVDARKGLEVARSWADSPEARRFRVEGTCHVLGCLPHQTSWTWNANSGGRVVAEALKFISDPVLFGRHIAELRVSDNTLVRSYVWGLDLPGTLDGAGAVGALLWVTLHTASGSAAGTHFAPYDGNGNLVALASASDGSPTARYEYGPFAEPIRLTGPVAAQNSFRFSSKRTCNTADLVLYEYRAYSPTLGRWPNRDPIGELSFHVTDKFDPHGPRARTKDLNLYGFVQNDPIDAIDYLGLFCCKGVWYNPFTHCCRNGKVTKRGKVDTGYSKCSAPTQTQPKVDHVWLEWDGGSAGFYPNGATDGTLPGQVQSPDPASQRAGKKCDPIRLDPCHYDIDAFKNCMQQYINRTSANPPMYHTFQIFGENCQTWSAGGVGGCTYDAWYDKDMQGI